MTDAKNFCLQMIVKTDADADAESVSLALTNWFTDGQFLHQEGGNDCCGWELISLIAEEVKE